MLKNKLAEVTWSVFPLHPEVLDQGMSLQTLFSATTEQIAAMLERVRMAADANGVQMGGRSHTYNSVRAQVIGKWAETEGVGDEWRMGVYESYFVKGRNIGDVKVLAEITESVNLDKNDAMEAMADDKFKNAVKHDWMRARELNITSVPTYRFGEKSVSGLLTAETLIMSLREHGWEV